MMMIVEDRPLGKGLIISVDGAFIPIKMLVLLTVDMTFRRT